VALWEMSMRTGVLHPLCCTSCHIIARYRLGSYMKHLLLYRRMWRRLLIATRWSNSSHSLEVMVSVLSMVTQVWSKAGQPKSQREGSSDPSSSVDPSRPSYLKDRRSRLEQDEWETIKISHRNLTYISKQIQHVSLLAWSKQYSC
jgi:hypothetical protein